MKITDITWDHDCAGRRAEIQGRDGNWMRVRETTEGYLVTRFGPDNRPGTPETLDEQGLTALL